MEIGFLALLPVVYANADFVAILFAISFIYCTTFAQTNGQFNFQLYCYKNNVGIVAFFLYSE